MKSLHRFTAILVITLGLIAASGASGVSAAGAGLNQPTASCAATRASVTFTWRPLPGSSQQWLDVSTKDNGFAAGSFDSEGPMKGSTTSFVWDGLKSGEKVFWRVNSNTTDGWQPSETGTYTPCTATASGVNFVFGTNVSENDKTSVREGIKNATDLGKELLGYEPPTYTIHAFQDLGEFAEALARWSEDPSPDTIARIKRAYASNVAGLVSYGDGLFIPTWTSTWTRSGTYRYLIVGHEYFHVIQGSLKGTPERRGTPLWLSEGSAELFGVAAYGRKNGVDFANLRAAYIRDVAGVTESLANLESGGRFGATANDSYPLAMLATEFLIKDRGWQSIADYFKAIGANVEWHRAFSDSFGVAYDSFAGAFESYRQNGYK